MNRVSVLFRITLATLALGLAVPASVAIAAPPVLTVPSSQTVQEGQLLTFNVSAVDPDGQQLMLYTTLMPPGGTFSDHHNNTGTFSWTPDPGSAGSYSATFVADAGFFNGTDTESVAIEVVVANDAPVLFAIGSRTVERGIQLIMSLSGYDPNGDALTYSVTGLPTFGTLYDFGDGNGALSFQPVAATALGAYFVQNAYATGPPDLVIAGLTVVDPMVAVAIGIIVLGEASQAPFWANLVFLVAGAIAVWGVFLLARNHPQTRL